MAGFQLEKGERMFLYTTVALLVAFFMAILQSSIDSCWAIWRD